MLEIIAQMLFIYGTGDLGSVSEEVEFFAWSTRASCRIGASSKSIIVLIVTCFLELIS